jgi:predicted GH43/DUF377 family glycosyl hydrolase
MIDPHVIIKPSLLDGNSELVTTTAPKIDWPYGIIRGGTPALSFDGHYLGFIHSSQRDKKTKKYTYYIGAYLFSKNYPFQLTHISKKPFSHCDFYKTERTPLTASLVIFPGGFIFNENKIYLCYGENDGAIKIMVIKKNELLKSLIKIR